MQKYSEDLTLAHEYYREQDYKNCLKVYDGFKFCCFPIKLKEMGAAWVRAVAIIE